ncbi:MAG TPA: histidine kinase N-terminal 7TM domain-containing protein [bacterium]|nr:histidine kinase N-terminal 7TM domain-containing protein [bacterium]
MAFGLDLYAGASLVAAGVSLVTALAAWLRRKRAPGCRQLTWMMLSVAVWSAMSAAEAGAPSLAARVLLSKLGYIGIAGVAPWFLEFALAYGRRETRLGAAGRTILWTVPAVTLLLVITNEQHHLIWTSVTWSASLHGRMLLYGHGIWYWVWLTYYLVVSLLAVCILVPAAFHHRRIYVWQTAVLLAGIALPWVGEVLYLSRITVLQGFDLATVGLGAMGALLLLGMSRFSLLDVVPVARSILVERMSEGVVVLDADNRVVDTNPAALALLQAASGAVGRPCSEAFPRLTDLVRHPAGQREQRTRLELASRPPLVLDVVVTELRRARGGLTGRLIVLRDVTVRERLLAELQAALADVRTLRGLLPICSSCKKIRDDDGYWQTLEHYVQAHSEARFSHGLCEDCIQRLYPELAVSE